MPGGSVQMSDDALLQSYLAALELFLATEDESALTQAYELGKLHLEAGHGIAELVQLHHDAMDTLLSRSSEPRTRILECGQRVQGELLSHLDGELRRLRDYQIEQRLLNDRLRKQKQALDQANEALRLAMAKAEDGARAKANFLANMSHELGAHNRRRWLPPKSARGSDCGTIPRRSSV